MRRLASLAALAVPSLLAAGIAAPAAMAADDCPNAAVRAQQGSTHLPNCMAYERVSPESLQGAAPQIRAYSPDGNRVLMESMAAVEGPGNFGGLFRSTRPTDGSADWVVASTMPPFTTRLVAGPSDGPVQVGWSDDVERVVIRTRFPVSQNDQGFVTQRGTITSSQDVYLREADGSFSWLVADPEAVDTSMLPVNFVGGSSDLARVAVSTARQFDPRVTTTDVEHVYLRSGGAMRLVSILPDGNLPAGVWHSDVPTVREVSADGRRVAFSAGESWAQQLYVRLNADDPETAVTREVAVGPDGQQCTGGATLLSISADGTKVLFGCDSALLPGAPTRGVYLRDLDGGADALRLVGPAYMALIFFGGNADFSRIYMSGVGDDESLVLVRDGVPEKIATGTSRFNNPEFGSETENLRTAVSPDGEHFAFQGRHDYGVPGVDLGAPGTDTSLDPSRPQVYHYAALSGEVTCVSCREDGRPTTGIGELTPAVERLSNQTAGVERNSVSNDGTVTFTTTTELDPQDSNGVFDAYAWIDGRQVLLSSGSSEFPSLATGMSADGRTIFLNTADALVPYDRDNGAHSAYAVRVAGGVLISEDKTCTANCQAPGPERPSLPGVGSIAIGAGNLVEETTTKKSSRASVSLAVSRSVRGTSTPVRVKVSRAGSIRVSGVGLRQATVKAKKAGTYRVTVRLSANGKKQQRSRGRLATRITARVTPTSGASVSARKSVTFSARKGGR